MGTFIRGTGDSSQRCCGCGSRSNPCDSPPTSYLECRTAEASITKCGFSEFAGYVSTPPKIYRKSTLQGTATAEQTSSSCLSCNTKITYTYSGSLTISKTTCTGTDGRQVVITPYTTNCTTPDPSSTNGASDVGPLAGFTDSYLPTVHTITGTGCQPGTPEYYYSAGGTNTLSTEWTTAELETDVYNAIPAFSGSFSGGVACSGAYYDKTSDELTITKRKMEYKFVLPTLTGYSCYKITWNETFTPEGGGSTTVTAKSYIWNGTDTETPVYTIDVPAAQGTTTVTDVSVSCSCS
ncbi:MAG: hypothetical protein EBR30_26525 [Cytophagia bacterium]|jgi:hypothetical protein|nr:hypothetical protein [Cytophagia bacterium]